MKNIKNPLISQELASDMKPFNYKARQPVTWFHKDKTKSNQHCLYCGQLVGLNSTIDSDKEHLIARNFVAKELDGKDFNLIFRACRDCNSLKSSVEGFISSVSSYNSPSRLSDEQVEAAAIRKSSRQLTYGGLAVKDAGQKIQLKGQLMPGVSLTSKLDVPPQLIQSKAELLCQMQVQGLFSLVTSKDPTSAATTLLLSPNNIAHLGNFGSGDWGNPQAAYFERRTRSWKSPLVVSCADDHFRAVLRVSDQLNEGWFWALEWNKAYRFFGGIYDVDNPPEWTTSLPELTWHVFNRNSRFRLEVPIIEGEDFLFSLDPP